MKIRTFQMEAMTELAPNADWYIGSDKILVWRDNDAEQPSKSALEAKMAELKAEYTANEYSRNRVEAYDSVGNQLDQLMKDMRDGTTTHQESCEAVKTRFPKP